MTTDPGVVDEGPKYLQCTEVWGGYRSVDRPLVMPGLAAHVYSQPHGGDDAGGDVHYVSACAGGVYSRLLLADVSGHGAHVAQTAGRLRQLMRRHVIDHSQTRLMRSVNREFARITRDGTFATAVVMTFNSQRGTLLVSNAGHPAPLLYRRDQDRWQYLQGPASRAEAGLSDLPLGIEQSSDYREFELELNVGDLVICYTDWLPEARDGQGRFLGTDGVLRIARSIKAGNPEQIARALLDAVTRWAGGLPAGDDVTLLLFQAVSTTERTSVGRLLLAPFRLARAVGGSYLPGATANPRERDPEPVAGPAPHHEPVA